MHMLTLQKRGSEVRKAAEICHGYLDDSGYFSEDSKFSQTFGSHLNYHLYDSDYDSFTWPENGSAFINDAASLRSSGRDKVISKTRSKQNLVVVLAIEVDCLTTSFDELKSCFPLQLHPTADTGEASSGSVQLVQESLLKNIDKRFGGRMKLEGGPKGPYFRAFTRRVMIQCSQDEDNIGDVVHEALQKAHNTQTERLMHDAERETTEGRSNSADEFLISEEDLLGPIPNTSTFQSDAWNELQSMIGLEAVKSSIRSFLNASFLNYHRELQEQNPLQVGLSRLFIGPPGTGKPISFQ